MFQDFSKAVHTKFCEMSKNELYVTNVEDVFEHYLAMYPAGSNPIFRKRTVYDCQCCKHFIRRVGKLVTIKNGMLDTVWIFLDLPEPFNLVAGRMDQLVRNAPILGIFRTKEYKYSVEYNYDNATNERHDHFYAEIATKHFHTEPDTPIGAVGTRFQVFKRGLETLKEEYFVEVLDLIDSNSLYRGAEFRPVVQGFLDLIKKCTTVPLIWEYVNSPYATFRNTAIGNLLVQRSEGIDLETAMKAYEKTVAPINYKRPTSVITQGMVEKAVQKLTDLGLGAAIYRKYASLSDVSVNDVLFVDNKSRSKMKDGISLLLESSVKARTVNIDKATPVDPESFVKHVLPGSTSLELFLENRHTGNFVSLTKGNGESRIFKWDNDFAWSYDGDVTDSVKQRVKAAGGNIDAKLRVSLSWYNFDDLDLHAFLPGGNYVYFADKQGILDVDMNAGHGKVRNAVENLAFNKLVDGIYEIEVEQFRQRETVDVGFSIEVEFEGVINTFSYDKAVKGRVSCFRIEIKNGKMVNLNTSKELKGGSSSQDKWGVKTQALVPVVSMMYSPNHWGGSIGAKHLIFALEGCKNPDPTRGIYNEFLRNDLQEHRKVFEVLGNKTKCPYVEDQVSGVGFTASRNDSVTIVVDERRPYTINF